VLWRIFGPQREIVVEGSKNLHKEKLHNLYSSSDVIRISRGYWDDKNQGG
jgi:hypothetical protein